MTADDDRSMPDAVPLAQSDAIIARAMTVTASKLYVLINLRHLQDELGQG